MGSRAVQIQLFFPWRLVFLGVVMVACGAVLVVRLWKLQVTQAPEHQARLARQSLRSIRLAGTRGRLLDRNGVRLADNRPSYCLSVYLEELRQPGPRQRTVDAVMDTLYRLAEVMDRPCAIGEQEVWSHLRRRTPLALVAWRDLDPVAMARFSEHEFEFPGVTLTVEPVRVYPEGSLAAHLLGYVGRADEEALAEEEVADAEAAGLDAPAPYHYYLPDMAGRSGLEKSLDEDLRAPSGGRLEIQVDVAGFKYQTVEDASIEPGHGSDVTLSVDVRIQRAAERALAGQRGAVVILDPRNGDILAMASSPTFDPNDFIPSISKDRWQKLQGPDRPLYNRAAAGEYAPGSTFKPITLLAAMHSGKIRPEMRFTCDGAFQLGSARFRCWQTWGHGSIDLAHAIRYSCNVYLYHAGLMCGPEEIQRMARHFGLGRKTGIELDYERPGLIPDDAWKRKARGEGWRDGDTCNLSIGQGATLVTPLQSALYTAALANGGTLWKPRLVLARTAPDGRRTPVPAQAVTREKLWSNSDFAVIRRGMRDVVQASDGSGRRARVDAFEIAAKTGTAEYGAKGSGKKMTWMIAFAPYEAPRYALSFLVEDGASGGSTVAPLVRKLFLDIIENVEEADAEVGGGDDIAPAEPAAPAAPDVPPAVADEAAPPAEESANEEPANEESAPADDETFDDETFDDDALPPAGATWDIEEAA